MLDFDFNPEKRILTCVFKGRLDTVLCTQISLELESKYNSLTEHGNPDELLDFDLDFDLKDVDYISSSFIRLCVAGRKKVREGGFSIRNVNPFIKKTFKISGLDEILSVT